MGPDCIVLHTLARQQDRASQEVLKHVYHLRIDWIQVSRPGRNIEGQYRVFSGRPFPGTADLTQPSNAGLAAIHVCLVGDFDEGHPANALLRKGILIVERLTRRYEIPLHKIFGHSELAHQLGDGWPCGNPRQCPGKGFNAERLRRKLQSALAEKRDRSDARRTQAWFAPGFAPPGVAQGESAKSA